MKRAVATFFLLLLVGLGFSAPTRVFADVNSIVPNAADFGKILDQNSPNGTLGKTYLESHSINTQANDMNGATCLLVGCSKNPKGAGYIGNSALAQVGSGITMMYTNPPADFALWVHDTAQTLGFEPKQVNAQGVGFSGLASLLPVWKAFRNVAYLLLALAMIIIGFMVMFRQKIDPKTVVTVQNSLPRIVITMLLITFSYAIVGLLIDVMYLVITFINIIMLSGFSGTKDLIANFTSGGILSLFAAVLGPSYAIANLSQAGSAKFFLDLVLTSITNAFTYGLLTITTNGVAPGVVFQLVLAVIYVIAFFRILFMLLGNYVQILIALITGPLQILLDVFPGSKGFSSWILNLVSNLIAFPITIFLLILGNVIGQNFLNGNSLWVPPMLPQPTVIPNTPVGTITIPQTGAGGLTLVLISLGIILVIPTAVKSIRELLKAKPAVQFGGGQGGGVQQLLSTFYYLNMLTPASIKEKIGLAKKQQ